MGYNEEQSVIRANSPASPMSHGYRIRTSTPCHVRNGILQCQAENVRRQPWGKPRHGRTLHRDQEHTGHSTPQYLVTQSPREATTSRFHSQKTLQQPHMPQQQLRSRNSTQLQAPARCDTHAHGRNAEILHTPTNPPTNSSSPAETVPVTTIPNTLQ